MEKFSTFIAEQKNTHMTHIEDKVLYGGVDGTRQAILALRSLRDMLAGHKEGTVSVKWDGAPAVFAGTDPRDGKFFVAKKGIFAKTPKVYKTVDDITSDTSGDLAAKLTMALQYLPELGIRGVVQGDFLFSNSDLSTATIDGEKYLTFHPNTIVYAVPFNSDLAKQIRSAKIGIVWHTTYKGKTFESMKASYGVDVSKFKKSKNVWSQDAFIRDLTNATLSKADTVEVTQHLSNAGKIFNKIASNTLKQLENNIEIARMIETYNNTFVRSGTVIKDTRKHVEGLIKWIEARHQKELSQLKTELAKARKMKKHDEVWEFFSPSNRHNLKLIFDLQQHIVLAKLKLINKLNSLNNIDTFVRTKNGYKVTGAEGYVAIDTLGGDAVKLVDRMEFSYNNFSPDILKGWDKPGRN